MVDGSVIGIKNANLPEGRAIPWFQTPALSYQQLQPIRNRFRDQPRETIGPDTPHDSIGVNILVRDFSGDQLPEDNSWRKHRFEMDLSGMVFELTKTPDVHFVTAWFILDDFRSHPGDRSTKGHLQTLSILQLARGSKVTDLQSIIRSHQNTKKPRG
jgi:hypothetical protein